MISADRIPRKPSRRWSRKVLSLKAHWRAFRVNEKREVGRHDWCMAQALALITIGTP